MRRTRLIGIVLAAGAVFAVVVATVLALGAQAKGTDRQAQPAPSVAWPAGPDLQIIGLGGPEIGVTIRDTDKGEGVAVSDVRSGSPASKAGIKVGDVITEFDGEKVRSTRQLTRLVQETASGRTVKVAVTRDGKRVDLSVTPEVRAGAAWSDRLQADTDTLRQDLRDRFGGNTFLFRSPGSGRLEILPPEVGSDPLGIFVQPGGRLGVSVEDLTPQLAAYFGVKEGALVAAVTEGSAAAKSGLKAGDVITAINDKTVTGSSDLVRRLREAGTDAEITIALVRDHKAMTVKAKLESPASRSPRIVRRTIIA
jgi:S1-C subfamily serine protease